MEDEDPLEEVDGGDEEEVVLAVGTLSKEALKRGDEADCDFARKCY